MTDVMKYDAACRAIAECKSLLEAKDLADKAGAMEVYARAAKNEQLELDAKVIRMRATRRLGQMIKSEGDAGRLNIGAKGIGKKPDQVRVDKLPTLDSQGIDKYLADKARKLSALSEKEFEIKANGVRTRKQSKRDKSNKSKGSGSRPRPKQTDTKEDQIEALTDQGVSSRDIAGELGIDGRAVRHAQERIRIRREAEPTIDPTTLSITAQQKYELAVRQRMKKLEAEFAKAVDDRVRTRIDEIILPSWKKKIDQANELYARRKGLMDKETFNTIRRALHPDSRQSISDKKLGEAFDTFMGLEKYLLTEKDSPTHIGDLPRTWQDWEKAKRDTTAARRRNRGHSNVVRK